MLSAQPPLEEEAEGWPQGRKGGPDDDDETAVGGLPMCHKHGNITVADRRETK